MCLNINRVEGKKSKKWERRLIIENAYKSIIKTINLVKSRHFFFRNIIEKGLFVIVSKVDDRSMILDLGAMIIG